MKTHKKKKINIYLKVILLALAVGFLHAFMYHVGMIEKLRLAFITIKWYMYFIYFFLTFLMTLTIHELGHLVSFVIQGIHIRALHIFIFVFYKNNNQRWKFKVDFKLIKMLGGLVVPDLGKIATEETYQDVVLKFKRALIAGPNTTKWFLYLYSVIAIILFVFTNNHVFNGILMINGLFVVLLSLLYLKASKLHTDQFYGDYVAFDQMGKDAFFTFSQIDQYLEFSSIKEEETQHFLYLKAKDLIEKYPYQNSIFINATYQSFFEYQHEKENSNTLIHEKIIKISKMHLINSMQIDLMLSCLFYFYSNMCIDDFYRLFLIFESLKDRPEYRFYYDFGLHKLNFENRKDILMSQRSHIDDVYWIFASIVDLKERFEKIIEPLDFVVLECEMICYL